MNNEIINKISNLTVEYIDQITSDSRVNLGEIYFKSQKIAEEYVITMDIYVLQTNFIRHFNTHINGTDAILFSQNILEKIKEKYLKNKEYNLSKFKGKVISLTRVRKESLPCTINLTLDLKISDKDIQNYNQKLSK